MPFLELKIPPLIIAVLVAIAMWGISLMTPVLAFYAFARGSLAIAIAVVGVVISIAGTISFHQAQTTINPMKPELSSSLVYSGVYQFTRNPMYLGTHVYFPRW